MECLNTYNVTAQVYDRQDKDKQTLLINRIIEARSDSNAINEFYGQNPEYEIIKIFSTEKI